MRKSNYENAPKILVAFVVISMIIIGGTSALGTAYGQKNGESLTVNSDRSIYPYGSIIQLGVHDFNNGQPLEVSSFEQSYAGIVAACGIQYLDIAFLQGNYSSISNYDQILNAKSNLLDVKDPYPNNFVSCPMGFTKGISKATFGSNVDTSTVTRVVANGKSITENNHLVRKYDVNKVYGAVVYKKQPNGTTLEYKESEPIPVGTYTIIGFTLSGQISKPIVIQIVNNTQVSYFNQASNELKDVASILAKSIPSQVVPLLTIPAFVGTFLAYGYKKNGKMPIGLGTIAIAILLLNTPGILSFNEAYATYNQGAQGVEAEGTSTSFTTSSTQMAFNGVVTGTGLNNGLSVQDNQFVTNPNVSPGDFFWAQSVVKVETNTGATYYSNTCSTQGGSYTCEMPSSIRVNGIDEYWTDQDSAGGCPAGWSSYSTDCYISYPGTWSNVYPTSSTTELDVYTYANVDSSGNINTAEKYQTCTSSGCSGYTQINSDQVGYGTSSSYFAPTTYFGGNTYGVQAVGGECANCDGGSSNVSFSSGSYGTETYQINSSTSTVAYQAGTSWPAEGNNNICWWNTIGNSGGSNPTISATAEYGSCNS